VPATAEFWCAGLLQTGGDRLVDAFQLVGEVLAEALDF